MLGSLNSARDADAPGLDVGLVLGDSGHLHLLNMRDAALRTKSRSM